MAGGSFNLMHFEGILLGAFILGNFKILFNGINVAERYQTEQCQG